jgi:hypothetical protein
LRDCTGHAQGDAEIWSTRVVGGHGCDGGARGVRGLLGSCGWVGVAVREALGFAAKEARAERFTAREARVGFAARDRMRVGSQVGAVYTAPLMVRILFYVVYTFAFSVSRFNRT